MFTMYPYSHLFDVNEPETHKVITRCLDGLLNGLLNQYTYSDNTLETCKQNLVSMVINNRQNSPI